MTNQTGEQASAVPALIAYLEGLRDTDDRAALASLRRAIGRPAGSVPEADRLLMRWSNPERWREEEIVYLVGTLFALHPPTWRPAEADRRPSNMGASFRRLGDATNSDSVEKRFMALLGAEWTDLPTHLRHAVHLLRSHEVPVNWARLWRDLHGWESDNRRVQRDWARAYWSGAAAGEPVTPAGGAADAANEADSTIDREEGE